MATPPGMVPLPPAQWQQPGQLPPPGHPGYGQYPGPPQP